MRLFTIPVIAVGLAAASLSGCQTRDGEIVMDGRMVGVLLGAAAGGLAGAQVGDGQGQLAAVAVGTLLGAWLGGELGEQLTEDDRRAQAAATQDSLETSRSGETTSWTNPDTGAQGEVTPEPAYTNALGQTCRPFQSAVMIGDDTESAGGVACRQADGSWRLES